jgi:hypothetical protein
MSLKVETTGREDRESPWKVAVCGFGGAGKTLLASTAMNPLYLFFNSHPKIKSIADRAVPHVKLVNEFDAEGHVMASALDKLRAVVAYLQVQDHKYDLLVLDTGDELFQAMKEGRRGQNFGEFGPGDWGWLADTYREVMYAVLDLPMDVMVLYHIKNETLEDGVTYRELLLQGSIVAEVPGWFDVVAVLDTFEVPTADGESVTRRSLITQSSRLYPWVKDHSGEMPRRFEVSENFVGDWPRMRELLVGKADTVTESVVVAEIHTGEQNEDSELATDQPVPSPEDLATEKSVAEVTGADEDTRPDTERIGEAAPVIPPHDETSIPSSSDETQGSADLPVGDAVVSPDAVVAEEQGESSVDEGEAQANIVEALAAAEVFACATCGKEVDQGMQEISQIRFRTYLCRDHYRERQAAS